MTNRPSTPRTERFAVVGFARTGEAVARALRARGAEVFVLEDHPQAGDAARAAALGVEFVTRPTEAQLAVVARSVSEVVLSPGVPPTHPMFSVASEGQLISEIEFASRLSSVPIIAITGTNGKTTVTTLVNEMFCHSGILSAAAGNIGPTLIDAVARTDVAVIVAEVSSFQLATTRTFRPAVATWLNFAEDHLDWHESLADYAGAKAKIFAFQRETDVAVVNSDDPVVMAAARGARARRVTFGGAHSDFRVEDGWLLGAGDVELVSVEALPRRLPHDIENALAALATALEGGASLEGCRRALEAHEPLPHRVAPVAVIDDITFVDDSKATTPSAVIAALRGFVSVVLIAGGKNKGLDLSVIRDFVRDHEECHLRAVVAIGECGPQVAELFTGDVPVIAASSMDHAVHAARMFAARGDVVLLSPGCASFDWYRSYEERGADFVRAVQALPSSADHGENVGEVG